MRVRAPLPALLFPRFPTAFLRFFPHFPTFTRELPHSNACFVRLSTLEFLDSSEKITPSKTETQPLPRLSGPTRNETTDLSARSDRILLADLIVHPDQPIPITPEYERCRASSANSPRLCVYRMSTSKRTPSTMPTEKPTPPATPRSNRCGENQPVRNRGLPLSLRALRLPNTTGSHDPAPGRPASPSGGARGARPRWWCGCCGGRTSAR